MDEIIEKITEYIKEHTSFSAPEVQGELQITYRELTEALKTLQEKGVVKFLGGMSYEYNADLKNEACHSDKRSEGMDDWAKQRAYIEMRRQELIRRMQSEFNENNNDDDNDDVEEKDNAQADGGDGGEAAAAENDAAEDNSDGNSGEEEYGDSDDGEFDYADFDDFAADEDDGDDEEEYNDSDSIFAVGRNCESDISNKFLDKIKNEVKGERFEIDRDSVGYTKICAKGLKFCNGAPAGFYILHRGPVTELCDGGLTMSYMQRKRGYGYKRTKNTLKKVTEGLMVRMDDSEQLRVDVSDLAKIPAMYYYFYWLVESLIS